MVEIENEIGVEGNFCMKRHYLFYVILLSLIVIGCSKASNGEVDDGQTFYSGNNEFTIREISQSVNSKHEVSTFVTSKRGMGVMIDGVRKDFDDVAMRYCPVVNDEGTYAYVRQLKGLGYDVVLEEKSVLHSGACLDYLSVGSEKAVCVQSDNGKDITRLYLIDMSSGNCECIARWDKEFIEDVTRYGDNQFGVITCVFTPKGTKRYNVYTVNGSNGTFAKVANGVEELIVFPLGGLKRNDEGLIIDVLQMQDNERLLFNAMKLVYKRHNEAFAYGNDFRGRMSWDQSARLRGLCELYKKIKDSDIKKRIIDTVYGIMNARNMFSGIFSDDWNPEFLWSSKCYTLNSEAACILVENSEIMSALLLACNEGIVKNREIVETAIKLYDYYDQWYKSGHYFQPYGYPVDIDGLIVPWNYQNSMAEVCLGLWIETGDQKYLDRCNELICTFMDEWIDEGNRIYWHYWPMAFYEGWEDDGRSMYTPSRSPQEDNLFEDASHAGISVRLLCRYVESVPNGVVNVGHLQKIQSNMESFCHEDGFSRFISGDEGYSPRAWHYWISSYFAYLKNRNFEQYVRQGYLGCFPEWDSQQALFANARLYKAESVNGTIVVNRKRIEENDLVDVKSFTLNRGNLIDYFRIDYNESTFN